MTREEIRHLLQNVRPYFRSRLGRFTHKRVSDDWYFHALGFVRDELTYVFGINMGFFVPDESTSYKYVGMSVTVRANGESPEIRKNYLDFFSRNLVDWANRPYERYHSERGGEGLLITRYREVKGMSHEEISEFLRESIDMFQPVYSKVSSEKDLFKFVMRAEMPWDEPFVTLAQRLV